MLTRQWMKAAGLMAAVLAIGGVLAVLACAPAAPSQQSTGADATSGEPTSTPKPTFTPTPTAICYTLGGITGCEVDGPRNLPQHLRYQYSRHMEQKAERSEQLARGASVEPLEVVRVELRIYVRNAA